MKEYVTGNMSAIQPHADYQSYYSKREIQHAREDKGMVGKKELLKSNYTDWYVLFTQKNSMIRKLNQTLKDESKFQSWTESRVFDPDQIQLCVVSEYADKRWEISPSRHNMMMDGIR